MEGKITEHEALFLYQGFIGKYIKRQGVYGAMWCDSICPFFYLFYYPIKIFRLTHEIISDIVAKIVKDINVKKKHTKYIVATFFY